MSRTSLHTEEISKEASLLVVFGLVALGIGAWALFDFVNGGGILLNHAGLGAIFLALSSAMLALAGMTDRPDAGEHRAAAGLFLFAVAGIAAANGAPAGFVTCFAAFGFFELWRALVTLMRISDGTSAPRLERAHLVLFGIWLAVSTLTLSPVVAIRWGAAAIGAAWLVVPFTIDWGDRIVALIHRLFDHQEPPVEVEDAYVPPMPTDDEMREMLWDQDQRKIVTAIKRFIATWYKSADGSEQWPIVRVKIEDAPAYTTYILDKPEYIDVRKFLAQQSNLASTIGVDEEALHVESSGANKGILIQLAKDEKEKEILWYDDPRMVRERERISKLPADSFRAVLGLDSFNKPVSIDIASKDSPHLLLAGGSGSGKSSTLHTILAQILERNSPDDLKLVFIDPKMVTGAVYSRVPHLWRPIVDDPIDSPPVLEAANRELHERMSRMKAVDPPAPNWRAWNRRYPDEKMPVMIVVIDEATNLGGKDEAPTKEVQEAYIKHGGDIARLGRSAGVYLFLATQRPSVANLSPNVVGQMSQKIVHKFLRRAEALMAMNSTDDDSPLRLAGKGDALLTSGGPNLRFTTSYLPEDEEKNRPGLTVAAVVAKLIEKWGGPNAFETDKVAAAEGAKIKAAVAAQHGPSCSDREWLVLGGARIAVAGGGPYDEQRFTAAQLLPFVVRAAKGYPLGSTEFTADEIDKALRKFTGERPIVGTNEWILFLEMVDHMEGQHRPTDAEAAGAAAAPTKVRPSVADLAQRSRRDP